MSASALALLLLGVIALCAVVATGLLLTLYAGTLRVLHQLQEMLPSCKKTLEEAQGALRESRQILNRANKAAEEVEGVVRKTCRAASEAVEQFLFYKKKAVSLIGNRFGISRNGNGAGHGTRRHYR